MFLPGLRPTVKFGVHEVVGEVFSERVYNQAKSIAYRLGFQACFAAGTPLQTPTGSVMIENVRVGDLVVVFHYSRKNQAKLLG